MRLVERAWSLEEPEHDPSCAALMETLMCLANGTLGVRQTVDVEAADAVPGAFHEAVYDRAIAVRTAIVNLPVPTPVSVELESATSSTRRILELREGIVDAETLVHADGATVRLRQRTLVHLLEPDLVLTWGTVSALTGPVSVRLCHGLDWRFGNSYMGGHTAEIVTHHVAVGDIEDLVGSGVALSGRTVGTGARIGAAAILDVAAPTVVRRHRERRRALESHAVRLQPGEAVEYVRLAVVTAAAPEAPPPPPARARLERLSAVGPAALRASHRDAWQRHWDGADVEVDGDPSAQSVLRFGAFHLRQAVDPEREGPAHIPARGLTSEYHSGHTFFNTEFFKLPYWTYVDPGVARRLLLFRHQGLAAARRHAAEAGRGGARFPEEADREGEPASPWRIWDLRTGEVAYEWSGREKHFLSAAVAWGLRCYVEATNDVEFLASHGLDILVGAASYAESLMAWDEATGRYRVRSVMGGDEYHYHVDDNFLTNHLLAWSLRYAAETVDALGATHPAAVARALAGADAGRWRELADAMYFPPSAADGTLQQHDGYFDLPDQTVEGVDENGRPTLSEADRRRADLLESLGTRLVKEADIVLLLALFPDAFDDRVRRASYRYYAARTVHESSLSAAPYGLVAAGLGEVEDAYRFFRLSGRYDLDFLPRTGYRNGLHLAAYAGAWQIAVHGFAGFRVRDGLPSLRPSLPEAWERLAFSLVWRGRRVRIRIDRAGTEVWLDGDDAEAAQEWEIAGERRTVSTRREAVR